MADKKKKNAKKPARKAVAKKSPLKKTTKAAQKTATKKTAKKTATKKTAKKTATKKTTKKIATKKTAKKTATKKTAKKTATKKTATKMPAKKIATKMPAKKKAVAKKTAKKKVVAKKTTKKKAVAKKVSTKAPVKSIDQFIRELNAVSMDDFNKYSDFEPVAFDLTEGITKKTGDVSRAIPAIFDLFEQFPDRDFGAPGPLVHLVEACGNYEDELAASLQRRPATMTVVMMSRVLAGKLSAKKRKTYSKVFLSVRDKPAAPNAVREIVDDYIDALLERNLLDRKAYEKFEAAPRYEPPKKSFDTFLAEFRAITETDGSEISRILHEILEDVDVASPAFHAAIPEIFLFMEKFQDLDRELVPLQFAVYNHRDYQDELIESLTRKPSAKAVYIMVNYLYEEEMSPEARKRCSQVFESVLSHPAATQAVKDMVLEYRDNMLAAGVLTP